MSIQRHEAIAPLSRHHHQALKLVLKLQKASAKIKADADSNVKLDVEWIESLREDIRVFWDEGGQEHFREEEEILLPVYSQFAAIDHEEIIKMMIEHVELRGLVDSIIHKTSEASDLIEPLRKFGVLLEVHVRREERIVFPMIEKELPEAELQRLAPYFNEHFSGKCEL